jgi:hypothetical protein
MAHYTRHFTRLAEPIMQRFQNERIVNTDIFEFRQMLNYSANYDSSNISLIFNVPKNNGKFRRFGKVSRIEEVAKGLKPFYC